MTDSKPHIVEWKMPVQGPFQQVGAAAHMQPGFQLGLSIIYKKLTRMIHLFNGRP